MPNSSVQFENENDVTRSAINTNRSHFLVWKIMLYPNELETLKCFGTRKGKVCSLRVSNVFLRVSKYF